MLSLFISPEGRNGGSFYIFMFNLSIVSLRLLPIVEKHRPTNGTLHRTLSWAILFMFAFNSRNSVFFNLPHFRFPSGFQARVCIMMQSGDFHNVCPIHFQQPFLISSSSGVWFVLSHRRLLPMVSGQPILNILGRQLFVNICTSLMMVVVALQVSALYCRIVLTFVLKIVTLILVDSCFEFHLFFNCRDAALALPVLAFWVCIGSSCLLMMLLRALPSSVTGLVFSALYLRNLLFSLCILRPTDAEIATTLASSICISSYGWDRREKL
ncbi:Activator of basal transcription 1 [Schistosoma haematobium]|uniref:Activator of basal transcription 1 n=1 Tax=Schistosoma haematobium TaxID=6185 RepID=A0A922IMX7_SCHHA|nr:Activator of basal transcription 1 [Schistosoma haematobium]KAH9582954.1 Activator of basal transcription 1 [Schistosoma haematobium]